MCEKCENCKFYCKLNLFSRTVGTIGGQGYVSGWKVNTIPTKFKKSYGCNALFSDSGIIHETLPNDKCELYKPKTER